jgi:hypothetical protein
MMSTARGNTLVRSLQEQPWGLWWQQARRLVRIEVRRNLFSRRAWWIYFLAFIPTVIILIHLLVRSHPASELDDDTYVLEGIVQFYYVRLGVFFGCLGIFARLIRGEMIECSLHFYLLPVRREVLLLAKYAAGCFSALLLSGGAILVDFSLIYVGFGAAGQDYVLHGPGLAQLGSYLLGCVSRVSGLWSRLSPPEHDLPQSHTRGDAGHGMGGHQPDHAVHAAKDQRSVLSAAPHAH